MIAEVLPGLAQWTGFHEGIGQTVYSHSSSARAR